MELVAAAIAALGLAAQPYLGVACGGPNVTTCGRIGISISLRKPALGAEAVLAGRRVRLRPGRFSGRGPKFWGGYVHVDPKRLGLPRTWFGTKPYLVLPLRLRIRYATGVAEGSVRAQLHPGWG